MKKFVMGFVAIWVVFAAISTAHAAKAVPEESFDIDADRSFLEDATGDAAEVKHQGPFNKFGRGLTNILLSPGEYVVQMVDLSQGNDPVTAFFGGLLKGTVFMAGRILGGAYDVVTFPVPLPAEYKPLWRPATVIDAYWEVVV